MQVPRRFDSIEDYRYGFNGMEKDDEIKGEGNSYDFGARMLDPRVGRWFTYDQMEGKFPSKSTYNAFNNNPIFYVDPDGNEIQEWKYFVRFLGFRFGPYYKGLSDIYDSHTKFDKAYTKMKSSSKIFTRVVTRLVNSSRSYKFKTELTYSGDYINRNKGGFFDRNPKGTTDDPFTINLIVDLKNEKTYSGNKAVIFEEVFHAAQTDYALDNKSEIVSLHLEIEAKLVKNIEGFASKKERALAYEYMDFDGKDEIFKKLREKKDLNSDEKDKLEVAIKALELAVRTTYKIEENVEFDSSTDLKFAEDLYGQDLTNKNDDSMLEEVIITAPKRKK